MFGKKKQPAPKEYSYYYYANTSKSRPQTGEKKPASRRLRFRRLLASTLIVVAIVVAAHIGLSDHADAHNHPASTKVTSPTAITKLTPLSSPPSQPSSTSLATPASLATMKATINGIIAANPGIDFEVVTIDLNNNNQEIDLGQTGSWAAASTEKIIIAADFLKQVENGSQSMNETLEDGNLAATDLMTMIVNSNDTAWDSINDQLTDPQLQSYIESLGITDFDAVNNDLSAEDIAHVFTMLYENQLLNAADTNLLMGYLKEANYRQYIVPAVPSVDTVYHKIGLYEDFVHDAAIITNGNHAFVIVIYTNGNSEYDWPARATMMQQMTKAALLAYLAQS